MNEQQYSCLRHNKIDRHAARLVDARSRQINARSPVASILARAASQLQRREQAMKAWQRIAQPEWLAATTIDTLWHHISGDCTLVISAENSTVRYELEHHKNSLQKQITRLVPGVRRLRFVVSTASETVGCVSNHSNEYTQS